MLQATFQGHQDYITEVSVSLCDKFVASAGKDATVCLWDVQKGKLAYRLAHHSKVVNCVKFFCPKTNADAKVEQQILYTCSDDGSVHLFDISKISGEKVSCEKEKPDSDAAAPLDHSNLHSVELFSDDGRHSSRNRKFDSLAMNQQGVVVAGSTSGDLLVWRVNFEAFKNRQPDCQQFLGCFHMPKQSTVKFVEFSPKHG